MAGLWDGFLDFDIVTLKVLGPSTNIENIDYIDDKIGELYLLSNCCNIPQTQSSISIIESLPDQNTNYGCGGQLLGVGRQERQACGHNPHPNVSIVLRNCQALCSQLN